MSTLMVAAGVFGSVGRARLGRVLVRDVEMDEDEVVDGGERQLFLLPG